MKIVIVKLSALGDIIHAMVVLQFIKKHHPNSQIDWMVDDSFKQILENNPDINKIIALKIKQAKQQKSLTMLFKELKKIRKLGKYDLVIDMQGLLKSAIISRLVKANKRIGFDKNSAREGLAAYFYNHKIAINYDENTIIRNLTVALQVLEIKFSEHDIVDKNKFLFFASKNTFNDYIVLVVNSTWDSRNYPTKKFIKVVDKLQKKAIVIWANKKEKEKAQFMSKKSNYIETASKLNLDELKSLIAGAKLVIGNDTGPTHMAWALNVPSITIFGPTPANRVYQTPVNKVLKSRSKVNHYRLNKNDFSIKEIKISSVVDLAQKLLYV